MLFVVFISYIVFSTFCFPLYTSWKKPDLLPNLDPIILIFLTNIQTVLKLRILQPHSLYISPTPITLDLTTTIHKIQTHIQLIFGRVKERYHI